MELGHIKEFVVVAAMLRFRPAAIELGVSPSALSHHINALEAELGVRLLERDSHTVTLTPAGQAFLDETRAIIDHLEHATELAKRVAAGAVTRIRIGHVGAAGLDLLRSGLATLSQAVPELQFHLAEAPTIHLTGALLDRRLDIALIHPPLHQPNLDEQYLCDEPVTAILPTHHPLASSRAALSIKDLAGQPFVLQPRAIAPGGHDRILTACRRVGYQPTIIHEATSPNSLLALVGAGAGVSIIPQSALNHLQPRGVTAVPISGVDPFPVHLAWRQDDTNPLIDTARQHLTRATQQPDQPPPAPIKDTPRPQPANEPKALRK